MRSLFLIGGPDGAISTSDGYLRLVAMALPMLWPRLGIATRPFKAGGDSALSTGDVGPSLIGEYSFLL